jgi:hypothetical protein
MNIEFTVHFQKGTRVGARSLRMVHVNAVNADAAIKAAKREWKPEPGYRVTRVDHFEENALVIDYER